MRPAGRGGDVAGPGEDGGFVDGVGAAFDAEVDADRVSGKRSEGGCSGGTCCSRLARGRVRNCVG